MTLNKGTKFTAKFLMSALGVTQPVLFPIIKEWEKQGVIKVNGTVKGEGKGRPATEYIVV
jgi:DNA-binding PadR family transcriptional regulator